MSDEPKLCTTNGRPVEEVRADQKNEQIATLEETLRELIAEYRQAAETLKAGEKSVVDAAVEVMLALDIAEARRQAAEAALRESRARVEQLEQRVNALEAEMNPSDVMRVDAALSSAGEATAPSKTKG